MRLMNPLQRVKFLPGIFVSFTMLALGGCTSQNPRYRTHVSPERDPTLIEHAERPVELLQQALDNLDRDLETIVY